MAAPRKPKTYYEQFCEISSIPPPEQFREWNTRSTPPPWRSQYPPGFSTLPLQYRHVQAQHVVNQLAAACALAEKLDDDPSAVQAAKRMKKE